MGGLEKKSISRKELSHRRIVEAAGRLIRQHGYLGAGVDAVMESAGLTAGGFYAHFPSKEALFAEMIVDSLSRYRSCLREKFQHLEGDDWLKAFVLDYLSEAHRNAIVEGCAIPALLSELPRASRLSRGVFERELVELLAVFESKLARVSERGFNEAMALLAMVVGGIALARAVDSESLSSQILTACQDFVLKAHGLQTLSFDSRH